MAQVRSGRKASSPFEAASSSPPVSYLTKAFVLRQARDSHLFHRLMPTSGRRKRRNSVKACQTSWRLRYSKLTSLLTRVLGGVSLRRRIRSRRVLYRPLTRKTRNDAKATIEWVVEAMEDIRESSRTFALG